jgi:hypothetical protein
MRKFLLCGAFALSALLAAPAGATTWQIGDNDGYGVGIADNADHPFNGFTANYDGRSVAEAAATDGAQFTDTYSTSDPGFGPADQGTVSTFSFTGLGAGWTEGHMTFDMADFQATTFGAVAVTFNGFVQNWAFNDGFPHTKVRFFDLSSEVVDSINLLGSLTIVIDRNASSDFYGFDYAKLSDYAGVDRGVPEPGVWALMLVGFGLVGTALRSSRRRALTAA